MNANISGPLISLIVPVYNVETYLGSCVNSLMNQDYDMALAVNMLYCIITLLSNLITDLSYGLVDPRVRIDK